MRPAPPRRLDQPSQPAPAEDRTAPREGVPRAKGTPRGEVWAKVPLALISDPEMSDGAVRIMAALMWLNYKRELAGITDDQIGDMAGGASRSTVSRHLRTLEDGGWIRREGENESGRGRGRIVIAWRPAAKDPAEDSSPRQEPRAHTDRVAIAEDRPRDSQMPNALRFSHAALARPDLTDRAKILWLALERWAGRPDLAPPSNADLAEACGWRGVDKVKAALPELEAAGLIERRTRVRDGSLRREALVVVKRASD